MIQHTIILQTVNSSIMQYAPFIFMFVIIYFFMIRPQMTRQKKEKKFRSDLKKGDKVITTSGIHGKIAEINDNTNTVIIETGAGKIRFEKVAISADLSQKLTKKE